MSSWFIKSKIGCSGFFDTLSMLGDLGLNQEDLWLLSSSLPCSILIEHLLNLSLILCYLKVDVILLHLLPLLTSGLRLRSSLSSCQFSVNGLNLPLQGVLLTFLLALHNVLFFHSLDLISFKIDLVSLKDVGIVWERICHGFLVTYNTLCLLIQVLEVFVITLHSIHMRPLLHIRPLTLRNSITINPFHIRIVSHLLRRRIDSWQVCRLLNDPLLIRVNSTKYRALMRMLGWHLKLRLLRR